MCVLLSFHRNGYLREEVIKNLSPDFPELNIPILLIRANYWVDEIKTLAGHKLNDMLNKGKACNFLPSLALIARLDIKKRYNHTDLKNSIEKKLIENHYDKLVEMISSPNVRLGRVAFNIAAFNKSGLPKLIQAANTSHDLIIKLATLNLCKTYLPEGQLFELITNGLKDNSRLIRRKCIYIVLEKFSKSVVSVLIDKLFDPSFSLRELARYYLKANGIQDVEKIYLDALINKNKPLATSILGYSEVSDKNDFNIILPYLNECDLNTKIACV